MAAWTSRAAAFTSRERSNCRTIDVEPSEEVEVISVTPAMRPNCRSRGVATDEAIVSGLAPGRFALTLIVGNSTCGSGETGREKYATAPASATAIVRSVVPIGRLMNPEERLTRASRRRRSAAVRRSRRDRGPARRLPAGDPAGQAVEREVDDRRRVERQDLREDESSDDRHAERLAQLGARAAAQRERHAG